MTKVQPKELMMHLLDQIDTHFLGGSDKNDPITDQFITWCSPGLPFTEDYFDFAAIGYKAVEPLEGQKMLNNQFDFSSLVDFIPDFDSFVHGDKRMFATDGRKLSEIYGDILKYCKVRKHEMTEEEERKIAKFNALLSDKLVTKYDEEFEEETTDFEETPFMKKYNRYKDKFNKAKGEYNIKYFKYLNSESVAAIGDMNSNGSYYYSLVQDAYKAWETQGQKKKHDKMNAYIDRTTGRDLGLWIDQLGDYLDAGKKFIDQQEYFLARPTPSNFAKSDGWTKYDFKYSDVQSRKSHSKTEWGIGVDADVKPSKGWKSKFFKKLLPITVSVDASGSKEETIDNLNVEDFAISYKLTQVTINRPWFRPSLFRNRGWTLADEWNSNYPQETPSDGDPLTETTFPKGNFIAYPMKMIMIKDLVIKSSELAHFIRNLKKESDVSGSAKFGWGPLSFDTSGNRNKTSDETLDSKKDREDGLAVAGIQCIGFINQLIPKAPNPLEDLGPEDFE